MPDGQANLLRRSPRSTVGRIAGRRRTRVSPGVIALVCMLSALHLLNYLNYTFVAGYFNPPLARSVLLVAFSLYLIVGSAGNLRFHFSRSWDMYLICGLAILSAAYSEDPGKTLKYATWLTLSVYVGTELASRTRTSNDLFFALLIILLPACFLVAAANVTLGPQVTQTGRVFGALGSSHVDSAFALNFICLFLALRAMPEHHTRMPKWLRLAMWGCLAWASYQAVFGLTRSVWLGVTLALVLYYFRKKLTIGTLFATFFVAVVIVVAIDFIGLNRILPEAVQDRIEVTEQRYESGEIDPRLEGITYALQYASANPQGSGYAVDSSHNSYMNILLNLGWAGFLLAMIAVARSMLLTYRLGFTWFIFFGIGSGALLLHAFFEVQDLPGQANFIPLLLWYAMSRSRFVRDTAPARLRRPGFVGT